MAKKIKAVLVSSSSGDWEGLYVNGLLVTEDHKLGRNLINHFIGTVVPEEKEAAEDFVENLGSLPVKLTDVEFTDPRCE